jgi:hypothetical protein
MTFFAEAPGAAAVLVRGASLGGSALFSSDSGNSQDQKFVAAPQPVDPGGMPPIKFKLGVLSV